MGRPGVISGHYLVKHRIINALTGSVVNWDKQSMHNQQSDTPIFYSKLLLDLLSEHGFHASQILSGTGIEISAMADPEYKINTNQQNAIYENALKLSKIDGLGLLHGIRILPPNLGIVGYAVQTSTNLRQAIKLVVHYSLVAGSLMEFQLRTESDTMILTLGNYPASDLIKKYVIEVHLSSIDRILKVISGGKYRATRVKFEYAKPDYYSIYKDIFDCPVEFGCSRTEYEFEAKMLDLSVVFADPATASACEKKCKALISNMRQAGSFTDKIRRTVLMLPCESRNLSSVAKELNMSSRSLRRKLSIEQTTFQALLDEIRLKLTMDYLKTTELTLENISPLVGFSDVSNFRRAFKKWTGQNPSAIRNRS